MEDWRPKGGKDSDNEHDSEKDCEKQRSAEACVSSGKKVIEWNNLSLFAY